MFRGIGRNIARSAAALAMVATALFAYSAPASAHTLASAVRASDGCGWLSGSYSVLRSDAVSTPGGATYGTVYLLMSNTHQQYCAVTLKTGSAHGSTTYMTADVWIEGRIELPPLPVLHAHYAADTAPSASPGCVGYRGTISGADGTLAVGGRTNGGFCS